MFSTLWNIVHVFVVLLFENNVIGAPNIILIILSAVMCPSAIFSVFLMHHIGNALVNNFVNIAKQRLP